MRVRNDKKRNEIIKIAGELFLSQGYGAVSMATIASAVGGSKGTLYGYFPSKEELFAAFVIAAGRERQSVFAMEAEANEAIEECLASLGRRYLHLLLSPEILAVNRLVIGEAGRFPELGRIFFDNGPKTVIDAIAGTLAEAASKGQLRIEEPLTAAWQFKSLCEARLLEQGLWAIHDIPDEQEIMDNVLPACRIFLDSYRA